jgi:hypothetical protein
MITLKICLKHSKKGNHQKYGIRILHIYVQYLSIKGNYKNVTLKNVSI